ncbi:MAG: four helix bundle protein [Candidatus Gracilibacteria bacterium]|nr:four helix bundle protein [Candidatus Gracilibacteria bacterium]
MTTYDNLPVYRASYDFFVATFAFTKTFTKEYKYTLGENIKKETIELMMGVYQANSDQLGRYDLLRKARIRLETIRLLLRLTHDLGQINLKKFIDLNTKIESISKQLAMWQKSANK